MFRRIVLPILLLTVTMSALSQPLINPLEPEAPESLLELDLGDAEVDLYLSGGWTTGIGGGIGLSVYRDATGTLQTAFPTPFPGLETVPFFNRVNLTISLWLLERYFFESSVSDEFRLSSLLLGYQGMPDEFVQSVLIGNTSVEISGYPYLGFGDSSGTLGRDAPGLSAEFQTESSAHELMLRLEPSEETLITYAAGRIIREATVDAADYTRDRNFVLPDSGLETLAVYVESAAGELTGSDGRRYRPVDLNTETTFSLAAGTVSFVDSPRGRVLVYYETREFPVGHPSLGTGSFYLVSGGHPREELPADFSFSEPQELLSVYGEITDWAGLSADEQDTLANEFFRVRVDGRDALLLLEPGRYSPFEVASAYEPPVTIDETTTFHFIGDNGSVVDLPITVSATLDGTRIRVGGPSQSVRAFDGRYPFASSALGAPTPEIYGPAPQAGTSLYSVSIRQATESDRIVLDGNYVPGSVRVVRNGTPVTSFEVTDAGELILSPPLTASDSATVRYRTAASGGPGDLLVGFGNRFSLGEGFDAELALGLRWKPIGSRYSESPGEYPGYAVLSGSAEYGTGNLTARVQAAASYSVSDTTGVLRVNGMNREAGRVSMSAGNLMPGAAPAADPDPSDIVTLVPESRGSLFYRDFTAPGFLGAREVQSYLWNPPASQVYPYTDGGRIGPYAALSADIGEGEYAGDVMVVEYALGEDDDWVAAASRLYGGVETDLSGTTRIEGSFRTVGPATGVRVFIQIGALAEDLDGDAVADAGASSADPYLTFNDSATGWSLAAGAVNPAPVAAYREDADGDGRADPELSDLVLTRELPAPVEAEGWQQYSFDISGDDRRLLRSARAVRFVVQRDLPGGPRDGKLVFSDLAFRGTALAVDAPDDAVVFASEIREPETQALSNSFPEVTGRLDSESAAPSVLEVSWSNLGAGSFSLTQGFTPVAASAYEELRVYLRGDGATSGTLTLLALSGPSNEPVATSTVAITDQWIAVSVSLPETSTETIHRIRLEVSGSDSGTILLDEIAFWGPRSAFGAVGEVTVRWQPGFTLTAGDFSIVDGVTLSQGIRAETEGFPDGLSDGGQGVESTTVATARILGANLLVGLDLRQGTTGPGLQARHELSAGLSPIRLRVNEEFRRSYLAYGERLRHATALELGPYGPASLTANWTADRTEDDAASEWGTSARISHAPEAGAAMSATVAARATERFPDASGSGTYPQQWIQSFELFVPSGNALAHRTIGLEGQFDVEGERAGLEANSEVGTASGGSTGLLDIEVLAGLSTPLSFGDRIRVVPSVARGARARTDSPDLRVFSEDLDEAVSVIGLQTYLVTAIPVWELWDPSVRTEFAGATSGLVEAKYSPSLALQFSRPVRSSPWSLVVPAGAKFTLARELSRRNDSLTDENSAALELNTIAPNVFGRLGSSPWLNFYDSDEHTASISAKVTSEMGVLTELEVDLDHGLDLFWLSGTSLVITSSFAGDFPTDDDAVISASLDAEYKWVRPAEWVPRFSRLARIAQPDPEMQHSESIRLTAAWDDSVSQRLTAKHSTTLILSEMASVRVYAGAGVGFVQTASANLFQTGIQLGLEGRLQF